jgi:hypothetical protein
MFMINPIANSISHLVQNFVFFCILLVSYECETWSMILSEEYGLTLAETKGLRE